MPIRTVWRPAGTPFAEALYCSCDMSLSSLKSFEVKSMRKIMVLGAGIYQVPLIRKAKEMGLYVIAVSVPGAYPGFALADKCAYVDTTDKEAVLRLAREEEICAVVTAGTDVCVPTLGYVCDEMGLCGPSLAAAQKAQSKRLMKAAFAAGGVNTAEYTDVDIGNSNPVDVCEKIGYPVFFKAVDTSGSRGVTRVNGPENIPFAYSEVVKNTRAAAYIVEKGLEGEEFGAQAFVHRGEIQFILPHGDYVFRGDTGVPVGHFAPYDISAELAEDCKTQLRKAVAALGIDNCAVNADFMLCDGRAYVIEIGARAGATCLVEMTSEYFGIDYYKQIIRCAMGEDTDFTPSRPEGRPCVVMLFQAERSGIIKSIDMDVRNDPRVRDISLDYSVGDAVRRFRKGPDRIGQCIVVADSVAEGKRVLDDAMGRVKIVIDQDCGS